MTRKLVVVSGSFVLVAGLAWAGHGCAPRTPPPASWQRVQGSGLTDVQTAQQALALAARDELQARLSARLIEEVQASGPASAIAVCRDEAPRIAGQVGAELGVAIGRTSYRLRNPRNTPPAWAVKLVADRASEPVLLSASDGRLGALLPIRLQNRCLACHGPADQIRPGVQRAIAAAYPADQATGFAAGDLRGWFWVEAPAVNGG